jgi:alpha-methylacyl-CoA racemase
LAELFATRDREDWMALAQGKEACITPVLTLSEAPEHPHIKARSTYVTLDGIVQSAPVPRFSRTPGAIQRAGDADVLLARWSASSAGR